MYEVSDEFKKTSTLVIGHEKKIIGSPFFAGSMKENMAVDLAHPANIQSLEGPTLVRVLPIKNMPSEIEIKEMDYFLSLATIVAGVKDVSDKKVFQYLSAELPIYGDLWENLRHENSGLYSDLEKYHLEVEDLQIPFNKKKKEFDLLTKDPAYRRILGSALGAAMEAVGTQKESLEARLIKAKASLKSTSKKIMESKKKYNPNPDCFATINVADARCLVVLMDRYTGVKLGDGLDPGIIRMPQGLVIEPKRYVQVSTSMNFPPEIMYQVKADLPDSKQ